MMIDKRLLPALALLVAACGKPSPGFVGPPDSGVGATFAEAADSALMALEQKFYNGAGAWHMCVPDKCATDDFDWGADSLTYALFLRWKTRADASIVPWMKALNANGISWPPCHIPGCTDWSDVPEWDAIAAAREYEVTSDPTALARAQAAFTMVDTSNAFALGACPSIDYQQPNGGGMKYKTLETDSNYIKAALLLATDAKDSSYVAKAVAKYKAVRQYFLDPMVPLYTVAVFDDGKNCTQTPRRFFASVNGNMIWNGISLFHATGDSTYRDDAVATAHAVVDHLGDDSGLYVDLQAESDVAEPLIEAMYELASGESQSFARDWLLLNARESASARTADGVYGRFFNGPPPAATITEWQSNGGLALAFAAAALDPMGRASAGDFWGAASYVADDLPMPPSSITFTGSAIALIGVIGEDCCTEGHARVLVDGTETFDQTGIWQNQSTSFNTLPDSVLFAWRWPASGPHTLQFLPGAQDPKEGGPFLHIQGYQLIP
jgi:hypothetical protein